MKPLPILLIAACFVTLVFSQDKPLPPDRQAAEPKGPVGRYQLVPGQYEGTAETKFDKPRHTVFRIDTVTGKVSRHVIGISDGEFFEYMSEIPEKGEWISYQLKRKLQKNE